MSRFTFAVLACCCIPAAAAAQQVPGRDLLEFPLGLLAEAPALSTQMIGGLWNPANSALVRGQRAAFAFTGLTTPQEQGVRLEMVGASYQVRPALTATLSFAQASVADILKTSTDPQSLGGEISYGTMLLSAGVSTQRRNVSLGAAARYRWGSLDTDHSGVLGVDAGAVVDRVAGTPLRLGVSSFLFSPSSRSDDASLLAAADVPLLRRDTALVVRGGYSINQTRHRGREDYVFATSAYEQLDLSAGVSRALVFGNVNTRLRLGFGLRYAGYHIAIAREDGSAGFSASYQFLFSRVFP
jgi:hypothetical protein